MITAPGALLLAGLLLAPASPEPAPFKPSHAWIVVGTGASERTLLEKAGFRIAPTINRHEGQGTASITLELLNGFLELWRVTADWMDKGFIEMMTPREMPQAVSLSISSHASFSEEDNERLARDPVKGAVFLHPNGARRLTALRVLAPSAEALPPSAAYIGERHLVEFSVEGRWVLDVTLDKGTQKVTKDFQPDLPLVIHY
jgi:hypothetical protein